MRDIASVQVGEEASDRRRDRRSSTSAPSAAPAPHPRRRAARRQRAARPGLVPPGHATSRRAIAAASAAACTAGSTAPPAGGKRIVHPEIELDAGRARPTPASCRSTRSRRRCRSAHAHASSSAPPPTSPTRVPSVIPPAIVAGAAHRRSRPRPCAPLHAPAPDADVDRAQPLRQPRAPRAGLRRAVLPPARPGLKRRQIARESRAAVGRPAARSASALARGAALHAHRRAASA